MTPTLLTYYKETAIPALQEQLGLKNVNQVPKLDKIVVTSHVGYTQSERKTATEDAVEEISRITGQKPSVVYARKSVANFKVRAGEMVGARVTLRGNHMWEFLDRFVNITTPNIRDFRGFSPKSFDGRGNYAAGVSDQTIFPEVELDKIKRNLGFDIIFVTTADNNEHGKALLDALGFPFRKPQPQEDQETAEAAA
ncbi:MAG: 50S ribosomal protein L5 [Roseibacillus sp.]|jgi:large subunit ribosomal protein L5|nr:50S ribosomal protein L5 [Roseibacillus sp.]MDP7560426.1 50S ribosomal protein L5 [Planctomycetota bacterium]HJM62784.1 50S ribosomal protein L5 [Roseibacillus sp.]|tara:strand:- start:1521 stop:2108 length:588 start_codon:yes stop_codon:yes gene_type:complete